jgi:hypothetical protein
MDEWRNGGMDEWRNGRMDEWTNGRMEGWRNGGMEECTRDAPPRCSSMMDHSHSHQSLGEHRRTWSPIIPDTCKRTIDAMPYNANVMAM